MAPQKRSNKPSRRRQSDGTEYRFKIDAYRPDTMPMARLAEYMRELSQMLGEAAAVHFRRIAPGSTVLVHMVEREADPKVRERVSCVKQGVGPIESQRAYRTINRLLRDDNAVGVWKASKASAVIIHFPGCEETEEEFASIRQHGSIAGIVTGIRGRDETIHVTLQAEDQQITGCYTTKAIAKQLGAKFFEPVRIFGRGKWTRDSDGNWSLIDFKIESFEPLQDVSLSAALAELRAIPTGWGSNAYGELEIIRHGPGGKQNGGH